MKQHALMTAASILFVIGCATSPSKEDVESEQGFLQKLRECGESATISRVELNYDCRFLTCEADACAVKVCNPDKFGDTIQIQELDIDQGRCTARFMRAPE